MRSNNQIVKQDDDGNASLSRPLPPLRQILSVKNPSPSQREEGKDGLRGGGK